ncbi:choice-of-anchor I family protein [Thauera sp.]|uniref:choice-of-anchor I family protein n=1 Tax=Thauera sp. TaxID=1905334 RepID=UPI002D16FD60|nr:choice-of-anchor I family protein [Thauera sp.]HRO35555.1 choice-of-anchor I family protein [Thauera sp.]
MSHHPRHALKTFSLSLLAAATLAACTSDEDTPSPPPAAETVPTPQPPAPEPTPTSLRLERIGGYATNLFGKSAAEIPAYDSASKRVFVVNADAGAVDVLDLANPAAPVSVGRLDSKALLAGSEINSVAVHNGLVAVAIQASPKTDKGRVALYRAADLSLLGSVEVGALPDMLTFTPDGKTVLVANEGEPNDDYSIDPEGSISVIDVSTPSAPVARSAGFAAFNGQEKALRAQGVRIYGPGASTAQDFEPEYIAVSADGATAWATLQENNALARIDVATATVEAILPLGDKDHGLDANAFDPSDTDKKAVIQAWPGVRGLYLPDAIASYSHQGRTLLVTANEGDARTWGEGDDAYWDGDASKGFVEEFRVKHLTDTRGWTRRKGDDLPPQLDALADGGLLDPTIFAYCGAVAGSPGKCRDDDQLGRLNITWTMGYRQDADGRPILFDTAGNESPAGTRLMYDTLYAFGGRSFSIRDEDGKLVWDSGAEIERFLASNECKLGTARDIPCATWFNANHEEGDTLDNRSDNKGPEPEGVALGRIGDKTFAFVGLERMGGVLVYDITDPQAPTRVDYLNPREDWTTKDPATVLASVGDLGPEGLHFIPAKDSPNAKPLLLVGNEVSGTTAVYQLNLSY